jgi:hypothetical protein
MTPEGRGIHARLIKRAVDDSAEDTVQEGSLSAMARALFAIEAGERPLYCVETVDGRYEESDLLAKLQSGELED